MIVYKLTDQNLQTHGGYQWEPGVARETDGEGNLCGPGWLHYYHDPLLAVLLNPIHADIEGPILWEAEAEGLHRDDKGLKGGCTRLTLLRRIELPQITTEQRVRFGILCAKAVCHNPVWNAWADRWLSGADMSVDAAAAAAATAAWAAEEAAWAAARAAEEEEAAAEEAAWAAARAAWAVEKETYLDLIAIAREAIAAHARRCPATDPDAAGAAAYLDLHDEVTRLRAERERLLYVLDGVAGAIDTGRNEPLQVWRDQINIARQALKGQPK